MQVKPMTTDTCGSEGCGLIRGHKTPCRRDVAKVKGNMIPSDTKTGGSSLEIVSQETLSEIKRLRRSSGYGHND